MDYIDIAMPILTIIFPIICIIIIIVLCSIMFYKWYKKINKNSFFNDFSVGNYMVVMFRRISGKMHEIDRKKIQIDSEKGFRYKNKDFTIFNREEVAWSDRKNNYYAYDYDNEKQLSFNELKTAIPLDVIDEYVNRGLIAQIIRGLEDVKEDKGKYLMIILGLCIGLPIGYIISSAIA